MNLNLQAANTCNEYLAESNFSVERVKFLTESEDISFETHFDKLRAMDALYSKINKDPENVILRRAYVSVSNMLDRKSVYFAKRHLEVLAKLISIEGTSEQNLNLLYDSLIENKKFVDAQDIAKMLIAKHPQNLEYMTFRLYALKRQEKFLDVIQDAQPILLLNPEHLPTYDLLIAAHTGLAQRVKKNSGEYNRQMTAAQDILKQLVRQNLAEQRHIIKLGEILYYFEHYQKVLDLFEQAAFLEIEIDQTQESILKIRALTRLLYFDAAEILLEELHEQFLDTPYIQNLKNWFRAEVTKYNREQYQIRISESERYNSVNPEGDAGSE